MRWKAKPLICFWLSYVVFLSSAWKTVHCFSLFNCCLSVVLQLDKGHYPENLQVVFCPNKQHSFEPFTCLDQCNCEQKSFQNVSAEY